MSDKLIGIIKTPPKLKAIFKVGSKLLGQLKYSDYIVYEGEIYDGEYEITPKAYEKQTLETKNKILIEDVTVKEIPYFETSNIYGDTVYIGSEV